MDQANPLDFLNTVENVKYAKPSCYTRGALQSSQTAAEHMFRHAFICLLIPPLDGIDHDKLIIMALIHDITDFKSWDGMQNRKRFNMDYLACNLPAETAKHLQKYWTEY
ncbi:hypothetical protein B0O99DRAFT_690190 [Bisporella sp. PMI_857]|nr:hypothetical protein B0O99DRAFT_690190 [Bisporella sp. PMI_857]